MEPKTISKIMFLRDNKTTRIRTFGSRDNYFAQIAIKGDMIKKY